MAQNTGWKIFLKLCEKGVEDNIIEELFIFLFTDEEKEQLSKRVQLVQALLAQKQSQREIAKNLKISISKITRGSNGLKHVPHILKIFLTKQLGQNNENNT